MTKKICVFLFVFLIIFNRSFCWASVFPAGVSEILKNSWEHYGRRLIAEDGRPLGDCDRNDLDGDGDYRELVTYSEGAGYVMLRAVYINDQKTFDKVWLWAFKNLWRRNIKEVYCWQKDEHRPNFWESLPVSKKDNLFAWRFCPQIEGTQKGGVIFYTFRGSDYLWRDGMDSASDADQDIAAALILADRLWGSEENSEVKNYLKCGQMILGDIWQKEVKNIGGRFYLLAGDKYGEINGVNPSYFRPAYYATIFSEADPEHPWPSLIESSYQVLLKCREINLPDERGNLIKSKQNLPPNWLSLDSYGRPIANPWNKNGYLFGWDAFRVLYQIALHYQVTQDPMALSYLKDSLAPSFDFGPNYFLKAQLAERGKILGGYCLDGQVTDREGLARELVGPDGAYLAYFYAASDLESAEKIWQSLLASYHSSGFWGGDPYEYYQQNWAWFGLEFTTGHSASLFASQKSPQLALK